jgi:hypothetical protein
MSTVSRSDLKLIVKQCLLEILGEGLAGEPLIEQHRAAPNRTQINGSAGAQRSSNARRRPEFDPRLDTPVGRGRQQNSVMKQAIKEGSGGNPILAEMLTDTAHTTLPTQLSHGDSMGSQLPGSVSHGIIQQEQFDGTPEDVFGEVAAPRADGSSHWADLAFASPFKKSA